MFIFPQPGGSPLLSLLVGLAAIAIVIGLIIFFLPLIAGIFLAAVVLIGAVILWGWIKRKFGLESSDERRFREAMEAAQRTAREQFRSGMKPSGTVYEREEVLVTKSDSRNADACRTWKTLKKIHRSPTKKRLTAGSPTLNRHLNGKAPVAAPFHL